MTRLMRIILAAVLISGAVVLLGSCAGKKEVRPTAEAAAAREEGAAELPAPFLGEEAPKEAAQAEEAPPERRPRPLAARLEGKDADKQIILNFENADIKTVIETVGDILGLNYILGPGVSGQVTIQSNNKFPVKDLFSVFQAVLEMNNLTAVKEGEFYTILPIDQAKGLPLEVETGKEVKYTMDSQLVTQIISIEYVKAADASNILKSLLPRGADVVVYEPTNLLIVTARPNALRRIMKILEAVDIAETETEAVRTFVYYVEHGEAKTLADILKAIYEEGAKASTTKSAPIPAASRRRSTAARRRTPTAAPTPETKAPSTTTITGTLTGEVVITAYEDINAIIVKATPKNYLTIVDSLKKLDVPRKQVLIDVTVAEVTLDDEFEFGVQWALKTKGVLGTESASAAGGFSSGDKTLDLDALSSAAPGVFGAVLDPGKVAGLVQALDDRSLVKLISNPSVLATDTKEARIEVGRDVPTATGSVTTDTTSINTVGQIQYRKTGAILEVTPYVNSKNRVTLKISQEISNVLDLVSAGGINSPTFSNRTAKTTAVIEDGHSLVLGGLISEEKTKSRVGLPILMDIPILGYLFGSTSWVTSRTEFIIMITPHIITSVEDADYITEEYKSRVRTIQKRIDIEGNGGIK